MTNKMKPMNKNKSVKHYKHTSNSKKYHKKKNKLQDHHFSERTKYNVSNVEAILNAKESHTKNVKDIKYKELYPYLVEHLNNKDGKYRKLKQKDIVDILRLSIVKSSEFSKYKMRIDNFVNDDVIIELNKEFLSNRRKSLKTLLLCLKRQGIIPLEIIDDIKEYGIKLIVPRTNIYRILPDDVVKAIYKFYCLDNEINNINDDIESQEMIISLNKEKQNILDKFIRKYARNGKPEFYRFVKNVLYGYGYRRNIFDRTRINDYFENYQHLNSYLNYIIIDNNQTFYNDNINDIINLYR